MQLRLRPDLHALPRTSIVAATWLLALALTAWIAAGWYWRLNGSPVQAARPAPVSDPMTAAQDIASRQLFGAPSATIAASTAAPISDITVIGLSTRWGKLPGYAVIINGNSPQAAVVEGEEIATGVRLVHVMQDGIEIERNGAKEQIRLNGGSRPTSEGTQPYRPNIQQQPAAGAASAPPPAEN